MPEKKIVVTCRVPRGLLYDDVLLYVLRKLRGIGGLYPTTLKIVYCDVFSTSRMTDYQFVAVADERAIPLMKQRDIVLEIEDYVEPPPPPAAENVAQIFDDGEPPGGVATGGFGPLAEPYATIWKLSKPIRFVLSVTVLTPLVSAINTYEKARSRYYRDWA